jgi:arabinogalactan endo-1,4-beta-galactosidase
LLIHIPGPDPDADQWGNMNKLTNTINGAAGNWNNVATLLKAGVDGVKAVDPTIKIMLHLENTNSFPAVVAWVNAVRTRGVQPDVLGLSCYPTFQGEPAVWKDTFEQLTENLNGLSFVIAEYNPRATEANRIMAGLPDGKGLGTFFWEPTQSGSWGASLFHRNGDVLEADAEAFEEFDALRGELSL